MGRGGINMAAYWATKDLIGTTMSITYTFKITELETAPSENGLDNVVKTIHWNYIGADETNTVNVVGSVNINSPDPDSFINFVNLTESVVISWVEAKLQALGELDGIKQTIDSMLAHIDNPPITRPPLPWL